MNAASAILALARQVCSCARAILFAALVILAAVNAQAQQSGKTYRVGILETGAPDQTRIVLWNVFKERLRERGFIEDQNITFEFRWADGRQERLSDLASELVGLKVDAIVTAGTPAVAAAISKTADIPIVMATGSLPTRVAANRSSNVASVIDAPAGLGAKRLQLLREVVPSGSFFAILADSGNPSSPPAVQETQEAAKSMKLNVRDYWVGSPDDLKSAIETMKKDGIEGFVIAPGAMFFAQRRQIAALVIERRLPSLSVRADYAEAGILIGYGAPIRENYRQAALYLDQILRGAKPSELPVYEPSEFELAINMQTAKALDLAIAPALLTRARVVGP